MKRSDWWLAGVAGALLAFKIAYDCVVGNWDILVADAVAALLAIGWTFDKSICCAGREGSKSDKKTLKYYSPFSWREDAKQVEREG